MLAKMFADVGQTALAFVRTTGGVVRFSVPAGVRVLQTRAGVHAVAQQTLVIGARCLLPVALVVAAIGAMVSMQALSLMRAFGMERHLSGLVVATIVKEVAPGFAAVVVAMQGGAGIAAELAAMRQKDEIDALAVMGLDAPTLLAGPRVLGAALASPFMNGIAMACGCAGAYGMAVLGLGVPRALFLEHALDGLTMADIWVSALKANLFGGVLGAICAHAGFFAEKTARGVGRAANRAVVASVVAVLVANYLVNTALFGFQGTG